ncbi:hypothetical protein QK289_14200 [Exiguobacterium antarcticum]|uniref:Uncharacterized protein n=1 Tax=Exiguobacterium antarcticum TaxID=132920 RepID=A0ABT6R5F3_9BACL|nr:hypothetical protein [Exiguobacterium antarcticum]MDI3236162.1 hypothetical protein [Exiguobacterium antarcticum]
MEHLQIFLIPGRFAFLKTYEPNSTYISNGNGFIRVLQTNQDNQMTITEFENIEVALDYLSVGQESKLGLHLTDKKIELITYKNKQDTIHSIFIGGYSLERLQRSQLDFIYSLQKTVRAKTKYPTLVFRAREERRSSKYGERLRIYGEVLLFPPTTYDLYHFLVRLEMDYVDGRFTKCLNQD